MRVHGRGDLGFDWNAEAVKGGEVLLHRIPHLLAEGCTFLVLLNPLEYVVLALQDFVLDDLGKGGKSFGSFFSPGSRGFDLRSFSGLFRIGFIFFRLQFLWDLDFNLDLAFLFLLLHFCRSLGQPFRAEDAISNFRHRRIHIEFSFHIPFNFIHD